MNKGITLLEILFAIVLITIVVGISVSSYSVYQRSIQLQAARDGLRSVVHQARQRATASADNQTWGIQLRADGYTMFAGPTFTTGGAGNIDYSFSGAIIDNYQTAFSDGAISTSSIIFQKQSGLPTLSGSVILRPANSLTPTTSVTILSSGAIE